MKISLTNKTINDFSDALHYMKMTELRASCFKLSLPATGKKAEIITRIISFVTTGNITANKTMPASSLAKNYQPQPLRKESLMLYGSYKNDAITRALFKHIIGLHFHFTAFGIDWLNERWFAGKPPTYQEFADYWVKETARRKTTPSKPKQEWAYLSFLQRATQQKADMPKQELMVAWKKLRAQKAAFAQGIIDKFLEIS